MDAPEWTIGASAPTEPPNPMVMILVTKGPHIVFELRRDFFLEMAYRTSYYQHGNQHTDTRKDKIHEIVLVNRDSVKKEADVSDTCLQNDGCDSATQAYKNRQQHKSLAFCKLYYFFKYFAKDFLHLLKKGVYTRKSLAFDIFEHCSAASGYITDLVAEFVFLDG